MVKTENTTLGLACFIPFIGLDVLQGVPNNSHSFDFHHNLVTSQQFKSITCSRVVLSLPISLPMISLTFQVLFMLFSLPFNTFLLLLLILKSDPSVC